MDKNNDMIRIIKGVVKKFKDMGISVEIDKKFKTMAIKDKNDDTMIFCQGDDYITNIHDAQDISKFALISVKEAVLYRFEDLIYEAIDVKELLGHYI